ncbi:hypothetical protein KY331_03145, partial [Candidatus Woesearchaeota archaeon]|nr:hypothetical protein [Candidatus Woesearchaeota archaeon]
MKKTYTQPWKKFAEQYLYTVSPSTPSKQDVKIIEGYLKKILKKKPDVLILGCTIAYRKLMAKYKIHVDMVDINKVMYKINTSVLTNIKRKEKFIQDNWLTMRLKKKYDLILGDFVINNIPLSMRDKFYRNVKKHLKDDGLFITRVYNFGIKNKIGERFIKGYKNKAVTRRALSELWWDSIFQFGFNTKTKVLHNRKGFLELKKKVKKYPYMKKWVRLYEERLPITEKSWAVLTDSQQEKELRKQFKLIK